MGIETRDIVVYAHQDGQTYVACHDGQWVRWPAERGGWEARRPCSADEVGPHDEMPTALAALALRLSGATVS